MRKIFPGLFLGAALALAGCGTINEPLPSSVHVGTGKALIAAESGLDAAVIAATTAVQSHVTTKAQNAEIARLTAPCPAGVVITTAVASAQCPVNGAVSLARQAYAASDTASFAALTANLVALAAQLATTHP